MINNNITKAINYLKKGNTILYPTDTVWGIGCDATNFEAVKKIYQLKQREASKALICLVSDLKMLEKYIQEVPEVAYQIIEFSNKPTTIIYDNPIGLATNLIAEDNTLAIRIPKDEFCQKLIQQFRKPIVSTSANIAGEPTPNSFKEITQAVLKGVDYVVNLQNEKINTKPSTIIKISSNGEVKIIRE